MGQSFTHLDNPLLNDFIKEMYCKGRELAALID